MKTLLILIVIFIGVFLVSAAYLLSGSYNIAATSPHWKGTVWFLNLVRERSIAAHSKEIKVPSLQNFRLADEGFPHYHGMCRLCHGAPGYPREEFARGLYPSPPSLTSEHIQQHDNAELYWIIGNGIKMTGMPAFEVTHTREEMWAIVAFLRRLPNIHPEEYHDRVKAIGLGEKEEHH